VWWPYLYLSIAIPIHIDIGTWLLKTGFVWLPPYIYLYQNLYISI